MSQDKNFNLPNILAAIRILLAPLMLWFMIDQDNSIFIGWHPSWFDYMAGLIFVIASVTDFFDGFIARKWNQMTKLGAILDPLADKMLMLAGFIGLIALDRASAFAVFLILSREFFITGLRVVAVAEGKSVASTMSGKIKTVMQMIAIGFLIMN
ncbi:MAG TPA: CDP-diacylglycerol--glycerol-3-phosphate 3-phosphatidyltransferase, partial [Arcobacter sp.]|nr:CDP-diacylglycerol--glycerol-3-phosphate 3-phosphatidyltransferase [Arcobacter sp.]